MWALPVLVMAPRAWPRASWWQQDRSQWPDQRIKVPVLAVYAGTRPLASEVAMKRFILRASTTRFRRPTISS